MAETNTEALDQALLAGASLEDINNIRSRHGLSQFQEVPAEEAPSEEEFVEGEGMELVGEVSSTEEVFTEEEEEVTEEGPYVWREEEPVYPDVNRRRVDAMNEAARASALGRDPRPIYQQILEDPNYDPANRASRLLENVTYALEEAQGGLLTQMEAGQVPNVEEAVSGVRDVLRASSEAMAEARAYVESLPTAKQLTPEDKEDAAFIKYLEFLTARVGDEIGWNWGTVSDFAGFLIPQENLRYNEIAKVMGVEYTALDMLDYSAFLSRTSAYIRSEAPEKRQVLVEKLLEAWPEIHGNNRLALTDFLMVLAGDLSEDWRSVESAFERIDQASIGGFTIGKLFTGAVRSFNVIRTASKLRNVEAVADAVTAGARGELANAGVSPLDAAASLDPSAHVNTLVKGADNTYATEVGLIQRDVDIYLDAIDKVNTYGVGLNEAEMVAARNRAVKDLEDMGGVANVRAEPVNDTDFLISYDVVTPEGTVTRTTSATYTLDDLTGGFVSKGGKDYVPVDLKITSPNFRFVGDRGTLVQAPEQLQFMGNRIQALYDGAIRSALKGLRRGEVKKLDVVLTAGDEWMDDLGNNVGRVFTRDELVTEGVNGVKLTERQYQAYLDIRKAVDHLHKTKNNEIIRRWKAQGIKLARWGDEDAPVKAYETAADALNGFRTASVRSHWVGVEGSKVRTFGSADEMDINFVRDMYSQGYRLTRAAEGRLLKGEGTHLEWAFIKADKLSEPAGVVLNYRTGYMPKIRKDAFYFVKEANDITIGGRLIEGGSLKTVRYFDNYQDAAKYTDALNEANPGKYRVLADRELSASELDREFVNISGGLFTGKRSEGIPFGLKGTSGERADSLEGLQRYIRNIARNVPMSLYREGLQQRWLNHAKDVGALPKNFLGGFEEAVHGRHLDLDNPTSKFLMDAHRQISFISGIRTEEERKMLSHQRFIARSLENLGPVGKVLSRKLMNTSTEGIAGMIRGLTFHLMLGLFSPAQFLIQATGAFIALSVNPIHGAKAVSQSLGFAVADALLANPAQKAKFIKEMRAKGFDMDGYELWDKSGMRDAIVTSNLDYHTIWSDKPYNANLLQRVLANSTLFFKQGELISARISFATAYNRWKQINRGKEPTEAALKDIVARAEQYRLNMTRPNSAEFQKGALSIPTQFQQVNTKYFEKLLGREFTGAEKTRLVAAQMALFGAAGVPLGQTMMPHILEIVNLYRPEGEKLSAETMTPGQLNALYNGTLAYMIQDVYGINNVVTGRMALGQDFVENLFALGTDSVAFFDLLAGPTATPAEQLVNGVSRFLTAFTTVYTAEDAQPEDWVAVGQILARSVGELPASTRNLYKSYDMTHSAFFKNRNGRPIAEWTTLNDQTMIAQALGFSAQEVADYHELNNRNRESMPRKLFSGEADRIVRMLADMSNAPDEQQERWHTMAVNAIISKYDKLGDRVRLIEEVKQKIKEPTDAWGKLMQGVFRDWESDLQEGVKEIHNWTVIKTSPAVARKMAQAGINKATNEAEE